MGQRIILASGKGGVGKSTITAGLGLWLFRLKKSVLLIDCDVYGRTLSTLLGVTQDIAFNLGDLLSDRTAIINAVYRPEKPHLPHLLSAPADVRDTENLVYFRDLTYALSIHYDYILLDAPAGFDAGFALASSGADSGIIVTNPYDIPVEWARRTRERFDAADIPSKLIINRLRHKKQRSHYVNIDKIIDDTETPLLGIIPEEEPTIPISVNSMCDEKRQFGASLMRISKRITGEYIKTGIGNNY